MLLCRQYPYRPGGGIGAAGHRREGEKLSASCRATDGTSDGAADGATDGVADETSDGTFDGAADGGMTVRELGSAVRRAIRPAKEAPAPTV